MMHFVEDRVGPRNIQRSGVTWMYKYKQLLSTNIPKKFLFFPCTADGWHSERPEWPDLYKHPHQHLGWPVTAEWFLSNTLSWCPTVGHDICPSIHSSLFFFLFFCLGKGGGREPHTPQDPEGYFKPKPRTLRMDAGLGRSYRWHSPRSKGLLKADDGAFVGSGAQKLLASAWVLVWI